MKNDKDKQLMELLRHDLWPTKPVGDDPLVASENGAQQGIGRNAGGNKLPSEFVVRRATTVEVSNVMG